MNDAVSMAPTAPAPSQTDLVRLTCIGVRDETPTIKTFTFHAATADFAHEAGQATTLALDVDGERVYRTFSVSSAPSDDGFLDVTIKAHAQGRATQWLHRTLKIGCTLDGRRPRGRFTLALRRREKLAFISAGSGAAPLIAMLRKLAATDRDVDVAWIHAARTPDEVLFAERLAALQTAMPNLSVTMVVSRPAPGWFGYRGRASRRLFSAIAPDLAQRDAFCCGPAGFMEEVRLIFTAEGGRKEFFHTEAFGPISARSPIVETSDARLAGQMHRLLIDGRAIDVAGEETILQAAARHGLVIPCGCGQGMCGTCRVRKIAGQTEMKHHGGLSGDEERSGFILACSTKLLSDASISLESHRATRRDAAR